MRAGMARWWAGFAVAAAVALASCGEKQSGEASSGTEHPGDVMIAEINERFLSEPEEERAWPLYLEASKDWVEEGYKRFEEAMARDGHGSMMRYPRPWHPQWEGVEAIAREFGETIELARQGSLRPVMGRPIGHGWADGFVSPNNTGEDWTLRPIDAWMDSLESVRSMQYLRQLAWLLAADATIAMREGYVERAVSNVGAIGRIGVHAGEPPMVNEQIYRMWILSIGADMALALALDASAPMDAAALDALRAHMEEHLSDEVLRVSIEHLRLAMREYSEFYFEPERPGRMNAAGLERVRWIRSGMGDPDEAIRRLRATDFASRAEMLGFAEPLIEAKEQRAAERPWERGPATVRHLDPGGHGYQDLYSSYLEWSSTEFTLLNADRAMQLREAARLAIALRRHKLEHGEWPEDLEGLAFGELGVPLDVATGLPLEYRLTEDGPEITAFWSRMPERPGRQEDWIVWPPEGEG